MSTDKSHYKQGYFSDKPDKWDLIEGVTPAYADEKRELPAYEDKGQFPVSDANPRNELYLEPDYRKLRYGTELMEDEGEPSDVRGGDSVFERKPFSSKQASKVSLDARENIVEAMASPEGKIIDRIDNPKMRRKIGKTRGLLNFNEGIIREVNGEFDKILGVTEADENILAEIKKAGIKPYQLERLIGRLENLKLPAVIKESTEETEGDVTNINHDRTEQLNRINSLVNLIDNILAPERKKQEKAAKKRSKQEKKRAKQAETHEQRNKTADELGEYFRERHDAYEARKPINKQLQEWRKNGKKGEVNWNELTALNEDTYESSVGTLLMLRKLRDENPDELLQIIPALGPNGRKAYYGVLKGFMKTHGSVEFSEQALNQCKSKNPNFAKEISKLIAKSPKEDDEFAFHKGFTRLPENKLQKLYAPLDGKTEVKPEKEEGRVVEIAVTRRKARKNFEEAA